MRDEGTDERTDLVGRKQENI